LAPQAVTRPSAGEALCGVKPKNGFGDEMVGWKSSKRIREIVVIVVNPRQVFAVSIGQDFCPP